MNNLLNHHGFMKYFKNTSWLMLEKLLRMGLGIIVGIWTARYLGPENFGILSFAISFVGLFGAFAKLGLDGIVVRNIVREPETRDKILGTSLVLRMMGALILLSFVVVALQFTSSTADEKLIVMIVASGQLLISFEIIDFYFQSQVKGKYSAIANAIGITVLSIATVSFLLLKLPLIYFAFSVIIEQTARAIVFLILYVKYRKIEGTKHPIKRWVFQKDTAMNLLKDSWPLILAGIAISMNMRIDQIMIKEFLGNEQVGIYAAAVKIAEALIVIPHVISQSIYPSFVNAHKKDQQLFLKRIALGYRNLFYISLGLAVCIFFTADFIIINLFGEAYKDGVSVLQVAAITILFASIGAMNSAYLKTVNLQKKMMNRQWINVFLNLILNYFMILVFGIMGAIYATAIAIIVSTVIYDLFDKDCREMNNAKLNILFLGSYK